VPLLEALLAGIKAQTGASTRQGESNNDQDDLEMAFQRSVAHLENCCQGGRYAAITSRHQPPCRCLQYLPAPHLT